MMTARTVVGTALTVALVLAGCSDDAPSDGASEGASSAAPSTPATGASSDEADDTDATAGATTAPTSASNALQFYPPVAGAVLSYAQTGVVTGPLIGTVTSASGNTVAVSEDVGAGVTVTRTFIANDDGSTALDPGGFGASGEGFEVTAVGEVIEVPSIANLEQGSGSAGVTFVEFRGDGFEGRNDITYLVSGAGTSSVTVPAGTFDAYIVEVILESTSSFGGTASGIARYWFVPGFALVKQEINVGGQLLGLELTDTTVTP